MFNPSTDEVRIIPMRCRRWTCPDCGWLRLLHTKNKIRRGHPQRHIVLTLRPRPDIPLLDQIAYIRKKFRMLTQAIRREFGTFEYMVATEIQKNGTPHLHVVQRGSYIPWKWLSDHWRKLTGAWMVHVKQINNTEASLNEFCKYLVKTARAVAEQLGRLPVITMSDGWLIDPEEKPPPLDDDGCIMFFCRFDIGDLHDVFRLLERELLPNPDDPGCLHIGPGPPLTSQMVNRAHDRIREEVGELVGLAVAMIQKGDALEYQATLYGDKDMRRWLQDPHRWD